MTDVFEVTADEIIEVENLLIPIIRKVGPFSIDSAKFAANVIESDREKALAIYKILFHRDYVEVDPFYLKYGGNRE